MNIRHLFDQKTFTLTYLVFDEKSGDAIIIDPVLDFDPKSGIITTNSLKQLLDLVRTHGVNVRMVLETHAHADHLSSARFLKERFPESVLAIGENIRVVQKTFGSVLNMDKSFQSDGSQFDRLFRDGETVTAGTLVFQVIFTPGHTPACVSYLFNGAVFTGDSLFMPDYGTGRCDFPDGSARQLYHSVTHKLYSLPDETDVYVGHDYMPGGRNLAFKSSIGEQKSCNIHLNQLTSMDDFIEMRTKRDKTLNPPGLLYPSIRVNIDAGNIPKNRENGVDLLSLTPQKNH